MYIQLTLCATSNLIINISEVTWLLRGAIKRECLHPKLVCEYSYYYTIVHVANMLNGFCTCNILSTCNNNNYISNHIYIILSVMCQNVNGLKKQFPQTSRLWSID